ncbi:MAG TPA: hypothetical protein VFO82_15930, partial [Steroidobacteraceae bacterium]|nr:hypothetical protein [Steroidobacteraceae bacterium]
ALALLSVLISPFGFMSGSTLMTLIFAGLVGAMGFGLLQREKWGRFMALGCSLLGWTLGGLLLIGMLGYLLIVAKVTAFLGLLFAGGMFAAMAWMALLTVVLWAAGVIISFKLFWHLCSPEGCEEFGVPPISAPTVVASAGAWLGLALINVVSTGGGRFMYELAVSGASRDADQEARRAELHEFDRQQALREQEAGRAAARAQSEAEIGARLEAAQAEEALEPETADTAEVVEEAEAAANPADAVAPEVPEAPEANDQRPQVIEESEAPAIQASTPAEEEGEAPTSRKIVKCRDNSGGVTFTQGYCPPGTRQVDMTTSE